MVVAQSLGCTHLAAQGSQEAIIALARKITVILHRMWIEGTEFDWGVKPEAATPSA